VRTRALTAERDHVGDLLPYELIVICITMAVGSL
jgi:hypothetical protein